MKRHISLDQKKILFAGLCRSTEEDGKIHMPQIPFNSPPFIGKETEYILDAVSRRRISGDGYYTQRCNAWLEKNLEANKALLTTSCTHALEMAAMLAKVREGDEVIMPSYTFVTTANAFVRVGAVPVFVDIRPDTMNIDERLIEEAITEKTRAIVVVHYAGVSCEMDTIMDIAHRYGLIVVEDAAQGVLSSYKGQMLGTIGDFGCYSFHETKNFSMGEGGAIIIHNDDMIERAEIIREKGTDRNKFFRGEVDKYTWVDVGSSYLPSDLNAAYLYAQLEHAEQILQKRMEIWNTYYQELGELAEEGILELPSIPQECQHNAHLFYVKVKNLEERNRLLSYLKGKGVGVVFHYIPLHSSPAGNRFGRFHGVDRYTTVESERLLRLPIYYGMKEEDVVYVVEQVMAFYKR